MPQASRIYEAKNKKQALKRFEKFCSKWEKLEPSAIRCFKKDFSETLSYYSFVEDRNFISTTNHLERDLEEVRRRIKTQGYFKGEQSLNLWIFGIISQLREDQTEIYMQPRGIPNYLFTLVKVPKYESAQFA